MNIMELNFLASKNEKFYFYLKTWIISMELLTWVEENTHGELTYEIMVWNMANF